MTAKATVPVESEHAGQITDSRPDHGDIGLERMGVDDRGHGVGGVVEAVDELKAEGDEQGEGQQQIGPDAGDGDIVEVAGDMKADVAEAAAAAPAERTRCPRGWWLFQLASGVAQGVRAGMNFELASPDRPSEITKAAGEIPGTPGPPVVRDCDNGICNSK